jgi:hypothetical protein
MSSPFIKKAFVIAVFAAIFCAPAVIAFPPQCDETCTCTSLCEQPCYVGAHFRSTCGEEFFCEAYCFTVAPTTEPSDTKEAFLASLAEEGTEVGQATETTAVQTH